MANTTWNPADLSNTTLSGGNLIADTTVATGGVRSIVSRSSGKYYWENTYTTFSSNSLTCGISLASASLASPAAGAARVVRSTGNINVNAVDTGVSISSGVGLAQGSVICIAVDFTAQLIWFRLGAAGQWNGSGTANPATATGGQSIAAISTGPLFAMMSGQLDKVTANFGDSAFTGAVPSGFTSGFPPSATTWSTTDKSAGATLSGGNLVVSFSGGSPGIRSTDRVYTGKYYWENTFTTTINTLIGVCTGTASLTGLNTGAVGIILVNSGGVFNNGANLGNIGGTVTNGWVGCVALDATNGRVWFRNGAAGLWNGSASANPATGVGGYDISSWEFPGFTGLYACANGGSGSGAITTNFGASTFTGGVPAGFTSGFPDSTALLNNAAVTQVLVEEWGASNPAAQLTQLLVEEWAVVIPPPFTSWNPGDKSANITLSGSNLIATGTAAALNGMRAVDRQATGKFYWEITVNTGTTGNDTVGVASQVMSLTANMTSTGAGGYYTALGRGGGVFVNGAVVGGIGFGTIANGTVICIAADFTAGLIWFRLGSAGNWNASVTPNPATGVGGVGVGAGPAVPMYPAANIGNTGDQITANFGDTAFTGTVPSGFTAGFPAGAVIGTNEMATQVGFEQWASMIPPDMRATQAAIEQWTSTANLTTRMLATQAAMEQWSTVAIATAGGGPMITIIT